MQIRKVVQPKVVDQLDSVADIKAEQLSPVNLCMAAVQELMCSRNWLVKMATYIADNPQFIASGFVKGGIPSATDGVNRDASEFEPSIDEEEIPKDFFDDEFDDG